MIYRTNQNNFNNFIENNKHSKQWIFLFKNIIFNKQNNITIIKDNRIKGAAFLEIPW